MNYLFLDNGFEEIEAITTIDLLRRANILLTTVSVTGKPMVLGAHNIAVEADGLIEDIDFSDAEMLILPGGPTKLGECHLLCDLLKQHNEEGKVIVAIWVDANGNVTDAQVQGGTVSDKATQELARKAALQAKFTPAEDGNTKAKGTITYTFKFN